MGRTNGTFTFDPAATAKIFEEIERWAVSWWEGRRESDEIWRTEKRLSREKDVSPGWNVIFVGTKPEAKAFFDEFEPPLPDWLYWS